MDYYLQYSWGLRHLLLLPIFSCFSGSPNFCTVHDELGVLVSGNKWYKCLVLLIRMRQMFTLDKLSYLTTCNCSVYSTQKKNIFYYLLYKIIHKSECEEYCTYTDFMNYCHKTLKRINIMKEHDLKLRLCNKCDSWKYKNVYLSQKDYIVYLVSRSILYKYLSLIHI